MALAVAIPLTVTVGGTAGPAAAAYNPAGFDFWVDSGMGPIKNRVFRAADGNTQRVVYALDGLRARNDLSGWEIDTDISRVLPLWNINVVMPIGGQSSFYSDWDAPSNTNGQAVAYGWETFLTRDLRAALRDRLGFNPVGNGVFGLSMGGSAALTLAAYHPDQFRYAASYSGYLNLSGPGMREALRAAMLDAGGFNIDAMWGPPWDPRWQRNDPTFFAPLLRQNGTRLWISSGNGQPGPQDAVSSVVDAYHLTNAEVLESIALANTRAFQESLGQANAVFDYTPVGVHFWHYWTDQVFKMLPDLSANLG
ncbi:diacylglycerol O-acyltransferase/trehalose O-mycolyltransferase [Nocardia transvalensis]|uniref:Diacylglycerol O-acyltransferase/trehalose O-mycolyltransferase n=2 Tax=Nocardia transvalensis TaxID=37333 RepID=A0A7W9PCR9_9NOCA|nr:alpha/beta hydrolase family protein [Nocardia transvalensis]MBB5913655.1 diacylglycerol O-acyltransferase/trehalose O-mycolyltransferase [Nocardia transvalensis]